MNINRLIIFMGVIMLATVTQIPSCNAKKRESMMQWVKSRSDIVKMFPKTVDEINQWVAHAREQVQTDVAAILAIPIQDRTYENTVMALDRLESLSDFVLTSCALYTLKMLSPNDAVRTAAGDAVVQLEQFGVEQIDNNRALYLAIQEYADQKASTEVLTDTQQFFLQKTLKDFKRAGLDLPDEKRAEIVALQKELSQLSEEFESNIAKDNRTITVARDELNGLDDDFITSLKRDGDGYILGVDYPTYFKVMQCCSISNTRKKLYTLFNNRAYEQNHDLLKQVISLRDQLAQKLGFKNYAELNLDYSMVGTVERAQSFLDELIERSAVKEHKEFEVLKKNLPESVVLNEKGKINPWDRSFVKESYKKSALAVDEEEIKNYFPMGKTIDGLLDIYRQFLDIEFVEMPISGLWHDEVQLIEMYSSGKKKLLGFLLLDLYPRDNKYGHACEMGIVPSVTGPDGSQEPGLAIVIANFEKATAGKPSLLTRESVNTFFHEFGHAIHQLLGRTEIGSFSGTNVKRDFVEMPSQMLEEWLWDTDILKKISSHYQTGASMPDDLIKKIQALKHFDSGFFVLRQAFLSQLALDYYLDGADKDPVRIMYDLHDKIMVNSVMPDGNNFYASFGHLMGYGAKYYGYMWSKVFALDLFYEIKKYGLLNPEIGRKYIKEILAPGGSKDPNELLKNFLGREPSQEAFFKDLGI